MGGAIAALAQTGTALIRTAPAVNGTVEGSLRQGTAESISLNGGAVVSGDLFIPGTPEVRLNGNPTYGGTLEGSGSVTPASHRVTLNGNAALRHVVRRSDAPAFPSVSPPPTPAGTRDVTLTAPGQSPGDFATLRNLTLAADAGQFAIPAGTYGAFSAAAGSGFVLGSAGATTPGVYNFQGLSLSANSSFEVAGPVVVTVNGGVTFSGSAGNPTRPDWLKLRLAGGGATLAGNRIVYASLEAPAGAHTLNGGSQFIGAAIADGLSVKGGALLRLVAAPTANQPPTVVMTSPADGASFPAPATFTLAANASDPDGSIAKVEFFAGSTNLDEDTTPPYEHSITGLSPGTYAYFARATDNLGASSDSAAVTVTVASPNQPPTIALTDPVDGSVLTIPSTVILAATAADPDGTVVKVKFFQGPTELAEVTQPPYTVSTSIAAPGTYTFTAIAIDTAGASTTSAPVTVTAVHANESPTVAITSPPDLSVFDAPASFQVTATAADPDGIITRVELFQDAVKIAEATSAPFEFPVSLATPGTYHFVARATDDANSATDSAPVAVTIKTPPSLGLPYLTGFEVSEGYTIGPLDGVDGWSGAGLVMVTDADFAAGAQSVVVPPETPPLSLSRAFGPHPDQSVVFVDLFTLPQAVTAEPASFRLGTAGASQVTFVNDSGTGRFLVLDGDGAGSGTWQPSLGTVSIDPQGYAADWVRLTLRTDYSAGKWDLYVGGVMAAANLGFTQSGQPGLGAFSLTGQNSAPTLLDEFHATPANPLFADADKDGMPDDWEIAHGLNPAANDRDGDLDADGITNVIEYLHGTDPSDPDSDRDGLSDTWEERYFGTGNLGANPADDADGDGLTNAQEQAAGTNPVDFYNGRAFVLGTTSAGPTTVAYTYDASGRLTKADYGGGRTVDFAHDAAGNLTGVASADPGGGTIIAWRIAHGLPADGSGDGADTAVLAGDGLPNLAKYAFGLDPHSAVSADHPFVKLGEFGGGNYLTLAYQRPQPAGSDLTYTVEVSGDNGATWTSAAGATEPVGTSIQGDLAVITVRDATPAGTQQLGRQIRLRIERRVQP